MVRFLFWHNPCISLTTLNICRQATGVPYSIVEWFETATWSGPSSSLGVKKKNTANENMFSFSFFDVLLN